MNAPADSNRKRIYGTAACLGLCVASVVVAGQGVIRRDRAIETEKLVLRDSNGRVRATLTADADGGTKLALLDTLGRDRMALKTSADDAALELYDRGRLQVSIASDTAGRASVRLYDPNNQGRASIYLSPDSTAGIELASTDRNLQIATQPDGLGGLVITDAVGRVVDKLGPVPDDLQVLTGGGGAPPYRRTDAHEAQAESDTELSHDVPETAGSPGFSVPARFGTRRPVAAVPTGTE